MSTNYPETNAPMLRPAEEADAPVLLAVVQAAFAEYRELLDPPSGIHKETVETVLEKLREGGAYLALQNGEAVGCVFYALEEGYLYLGRLSVLPRCRGRGIARVLVEAVEQHALSLNRPRVQLGVRTALPRLHELYTRFGYRTLRYVSHEGYVEPTYEIMEKVLEQASNPMEQE